jgi:hypothetical protein
LKIEGEKEGVPSGNKSEVVDSGREEVKEKMRCNENEGETFAESSESRHRHRR